jgi:hypothetical protein
LNSGIVLIAGGYDSSGELATAEPTTHDRNFYPRRQHEHHSLRTYRDTAKQREGVDCGGFLENFGQMATAQLFDPATGAFNSLTGSLNTARFGHTATLLNNGTVLIAGGVGGTASSFLASAEAYDPTPGTFTPTSSLNTARVGHTAALLHDGMVLMAGGQGGDTANSLPAAELYDPATGANTPPAS